MKKIISTLFVAAAFVASTFAADFAVSAAVSIPCEVYDYEDTVLNKTRKTESSTVGFGVDAEFDVFFNNFIGIGADMELGWPSETETKVTYNNTTTSTKTKLNEGDYKTTSFNMLLGPALRPVNTDKLLLIVTPGIDVNVQTMSTKVGNKTVKSELVSAGIGANARFGYKVMNNLSIDIGLLLSYNFSSTYTYDGEKNKDMEDKIKPVLVSPKLGATFLF